jgi:hypothetical protein
VKKVRPNVTHLLSTLRNVSLTRTFTTWILEQVQNDGLFFHRLAPPCQLPLIIAKISVAAPTAASKLMPAA